MKLEQADVKVRFRRTALHCLQITWHEHDSYVLCSVKIISGSACIKGTIPSPFSVIVKGFFCCCCFFFGWGFLFPWCVRCACRCWSHCCTTTYWGLFKLSLENAYFSESESGECNWLFCFWVFLVYSRGPRTRNDLSSVPSESLLPTWSFLSPDMFQRPFIPIVRQL